MRTWQRRAAYEGHCRDCGRGGGTPFPVVKELTEAVVEYERLRVEQQSAVVSRETEGNWLQRSWRPVVMLAFAAVVLAGMFVDLPGLEDASRLWDLLEIGLGGYILLEIGLGGYIVGRFKLRK